MSYEESEAVCDNCGKGIENGCEVTCRSCREELEVRITKLEEEIDRLKENK